MLDQSRQRLLRIQWFSDRALSLHLRQDAVELSRAYGKIIKTAKK